MQCLICLPHTGDWMIILVLRRIWELAWPLSWMEIMTFMKELIITAFVGHLGPLELSSLVLAQVRGARL